MSHCEHLDGEPQAAQQLVTVLHPLYGETLRPAGFEGPVVSKLRSLIGALMHRTVAAPELITAASGPDIDPVRHTGREDG